MTDELENTQAVIISERKMPKSSINFPVVLSILSLLIAIAALALVFFTGKPGNNKELPNVNNGKFTIAWINTDTIWANYNFVEDMKNDLAAYEKKLQDQYAATANAYQKEYNDYLKKATANLLSLNEQKKTEEKLAKEQQSIQEMDAQLSQQLMDEKTARNMEVHDSIVNFIARFNKDHHYTFIMERSYGGGILWADSTFEITGEVLKGLNKEYETVKKEREAKKQE